MGRGRRQDGFTSWRSDRSWCCLKSIMSEYICMVRRSIVREVVLDVYTLDTFATTMVGGRQMLMKCHRRHSWPHILDRSELISFKPRSLLLDRYLIPKYSDAALVKLRLPNDAHTINRENPEPTRHSSSLCRAVARNQTSNTYLPADFQCGNFWLMIYLKHNRTTQAM